MLDLLPSPGPDVVAFRASGKITTGDIERAWASMDAALDEAESIGLYAEITDLGGFTLDALLKDIQMGLKQLGHLSRFQRVAVVTDTKWIRTLADVEDKLFPGIDLRTFALAEQDAAMAWLTAHTAPLA